MTVGNHTLPTQILRTCSDGMMYCFSEWANTVSNGMFWTIALLSFCIVLFMATARLGSVRAFGYASFVGMIGAVFLAIMTLMSWSLASAFILAGALGIVVMIMSEG